MYFEVKGNYKLLRVLCHHRIVILLMDRQLAYYKKFVQLMYTKMSMVPGKSYYVPLLRTLQLIDIVSNT